MDMDKELQEGIERIGRDLRSFIELSVKDPEGTWDKWHSSIERRAAEFKCWETKDCNETDCPAYHKPLGRCWLTAGTMCGCEVQGKFAQKYETCSECEVYRKAVFADPVTEIHEHVLTLVHNLKSKQEELKKLATRDLLTGLFNRNYFYISIEREIEKIRRAGGSPMFVMIDINNFKFVNDRFGHLYGDRILKEAAAVLNRSTRAADLLVRLGGDEFLVLLPAFSGVEKDEMVGRIERNTAEWNEKFSTPDYRLSFSVGHAVLEPGGDVEECMSAADSMMYRQKAASR